MSLGQTNTQKVPCKETLQVVGGFVLRKEGQEPEALLMVPKGQAPRSSLVRNWGEGHIYPYCSQMARVERREPIRKGLGGLRGSLKGRRNGPFVPISPSHTGQLQRRSVRRTLFGQFQKVNSLKFVCVTFSEARPLARREQPRRLFFGEERSPLFSLPRRLAVSPDCPSLRHCDAAQCPLFRRPRPRSTRR